MITYGSYLKKDENIPSNAVTVVSLDTLVAIMAGLAMFPAMFAFGLEPDAGPGLVFVVVPAIFAHMGAIGPLMSVIFFAALTIAALTSSISLLEVVVAYLIDEQNLDRKPATWFTAGVMTVFCTLSSLSMGVMSGVTVFGVGFFDLFDILTDKIFLGIGGMLLAIFVGWFMKKEDLKNEITNDGTVSFGLFEVWYNVIKYVIPVAIFIVAVMGIIDIPQRGLMLFGLAIIAALMAFSKKL